MPGVLSRRALLIGAIAAGCSRTEKRSPTPTMSALSPALLKTGGTKLVEWTMKTPEERVVVMLPDPLPPGQLRAVIALHGRGESLKSPELGAMGWPRDYALTRAYARISNPPLTSEDFEGLVDPGALESKNRALAERRFGGLAILCPFLPDIDPFDADKVAAYGRWLVDDVLARAKAELPIAGTRGATGIDGVSHGGIVSLLVGLARADVFGAVGALQPAILAEKVSALTAVANGAKSRLPKLRLTTSHDDYFRAAIAETDQSWTAAGIEHDYDDLPGPHDYVFNRGPGAYELLFWHDRALAI